NREFGVVLIERGREVGGGDSRFSIGTVARIIEATEFVDGRWAVVALGTRRVRIAEWLPDDPYPKAMIEDLSDSPGTSTAIAPALDRAEKAVRRALALKAELDEPAPPPGFQLD